jgi:cytochrome c-type biogenesis protein
MSMPFDATILQGASLAGYALVFLGGLVTSLGPCNVATIPLIVGYVGGARDVSRRRAFVLSSFFALGLALTFTLLGIAAAWLGGLFGGTSRVWYYALAAVCFVIGLQILGVIRLEMPGWLRGVRERIPLKGAPGALALGLVSGLVASQCATPVLAAILTYVMARGALAYGATLLLIYALGRGVPVVLVGTFTGVLKHMQALSRWMSAIERAGGVIVIGVGLYFLWLA